MNILRSIALLVCSLIILSGSCKKNNVPPVNQLSLLPPPTQTGANTFGCLVNGQAFLPGGPSSASPLQCNYIYTAGGYYFTILTTNKDNNGLIKQIQIETDSLTIVEGQTFTLKEVVGGNATAVYALAINNTLNTYLTTSTISGQLTITKLDQTHQIVSGTFYFNAVNTVGDIVKVTDGRFDMRYTR
ncbi:MAG: DUF6252 family protein [Bacteroidota bacterium]|nr:DUF6252 family protein [Bacteroidota bacterium]